MAYPLATPTRPTGAPGVALPTTPNMSGPLAQANIGTPNAGAIPPSPVTMPTTPNMSGPFAQASQQGNLGMPNAMGQPGTVIPGMYGMARGVFGQSGLPGQGLLNMPGVRGNIGQGVPGMRNNIAQALMQMRGPAFGRR